MARCQKWQGPTGQALGSGEDQEDQTASLQGISHCEHRLPWSTTASSTSIQGTAPTNRRIGYRAQFPENGTQRRAQFPANG